MSGRCWELLCDDSISTLTLDGGLGPTDVAVVVAFGWMTLSMAIGLCGELAFVVPYTDSVGMVHTELV